MGGVGSRRVTLNECYGLSLSQFANGQPNGEQCHSQAADHAVDNRLRLGMIDNIAVANRAAPIGIQQIHQQSRVFQAGPGAQTGSEQGEHKAFGQKEIAHGFPGKPNGEQGADLRGALFHAEDKEEPHENERGEHEKKLRPMNRPPKSLAESPATASVRTSRKRNPICAGSNLSRNAASISVRSVALNQQPPGWSLRRSDWPTAFGQFPRR